MSRHSKRLFQDSEGDQASQYVAGDSADDGQAQARTGKQINPEIRVPPAAPRVLTQHNWLTQMLNSAESLARLGTRMGTVPPIKKVGMNRTTVVLKNRSASRSGCEPPTAGYAAT